MPERPGPLRQKPLMTRSKFFLKNGRLCGFQLEGHSGAGAEGNDIVCAAVSSAAYLTANTITDVCHCRADVEDSDGHMLVRVEETDAERCQDILQGFRLHMEELEQQYPQHIQIVR